MRTGENDVVTLNVSIKIDKTTVDELQEFKDKLETDANYKWMADVFKEIKAG